jgi:hypothetical protein
MLKNHAIQTNRKSHISDHHNTYKHMEISKS